MAARRYRLALIDHHPLFVEGLKGCISRTNDLAVVFTASDSAAGLQQALDHQPDLVVSHIDLPDGGGLLLARHAADTLPSTRIVFWGDEVSDILLDEILRLKAAGFLLTCEKPETVITAFRMVCRGQPAFSADVSRRLRFDAETGRYVVRHHSALAGLTHLQLIVLRQLARGGTVKDVARMMSLTERAVESHKHRIMKRLDIHDRVELTRYAIREGLLVP